MEIGHELCLGCILPFPLKGKRTNNVDWILSLEASWREREREKTARWESLEFSATCKGGDNSIGGSGWNGWCLEWCMNRTEPLKREKTVGEWQSSTFSLLAGDCIWQFIQILNWTKELNIYSPLLDKKVKYLQGFMLESIERQLLKQCRIRNFPAD